MFNGLMVGNIFVIYLHSPLIIILYRTPLMVNMDIGQSSNTRHRSILIQWLICAVSVTV